MTAPTPRSLPVDPAELYAPTAEDAGFTRTDAVVTDLRGRSIRSGFLQMGSRAVQLLLLMVSGAVLARLLTPEDFGVVALVISLTAFVGSFQDFGLSTAAVHREQVDHRDVSALFWVTLKLNLLLALIMVLMAPVLAWFYGDSRLTAVTLVMTTSILGVALANQHQSLLIRQMRFGTLTLVEIGSLVTGLSVGIVAALLGAGYWALVYQLVVTDLGKSASLWVASAWRPAGYAEVRARTPAVRSMLSYGSYLTGSRVMDYVGNNLDRVLLGYFSGATAVGLYTNSQRWSFYPLDHVTFPLRNVAVASLSRLQTDPTAYRAACWGAFLPVFSLIFPALAFMTVEARDVILVLLGDQWLAAVPLFRVMCIAGFARAMIRVTVWLYLSQGETRRQFRWGLISTPVMVLAVALAVPWGPYGVAVGFTAGTCLLTYPTIAYCLKTSHLGMRDFLAILARPALASMGAAATLYVGAGFFPAGRGPIPDVLIKLIVFGMLYLGMWFVLPGGRRATGDLVLLMKEILPKSAL